MIIKFPDFKINPSVEVNLEAVRTLRVAKTHLWDGVTRLETESESKHPCICRALMVGAGCMDKWGAFKPDSPEIVRTIVERIEEALEGYTELRSFLVNKTGWQIQEPSLRRAYWQHCRRAWIDSMINEFMGLGVLREVGDPWAHAL